MLTTKDPKFRKTFQWYTVYSQVLNYNPSVLTEMAELITYNNSKIII